MGRQIGGARRGGIGLARTGQRGQAALHVRRDQIAQAAVDLVEALAFNSSFFKDR